MNKKHKVKADITAVALAAGVSASTVSRSFNHPDLVNARTRKRIERAVKKLGYIRNRAAQPMHGKRSATIGLIVPTINHTIFAELIQSFSDAVEEEGFTILLASHGYDLDKEYRILRKFLEHRVDGVAVIGLDHAEDTYLLIEEQEIPAVAIWNYAPGSRISCFGASNYEVGQMAARHLLDLGHREIGLVFPPATGNDRAQERLQGVTDCLAAAGVSVPDAWHAGAPYSLQHAKQATMELLSQPLRPRALLCGNDVIARGAIYGATRLGIIIPDELSVMGIGDFLGSGDMEPALSSVHIPAREIGQQAGGALTRMIMSDAPELTRLKCRFDLVPRSTTSAPGVR